MKFLSGFLGFELIFWTFVIITMFIAWDVPYSGYTLLLIRLSVVFSIVFGIFCAFN
jgi:hypothetical protein